MIIREVNLFRMLDDPRGEVRGNRDLLLFAQRLVAPGDRVVVRLNTPELCFVGDMLVNEEGRVSEGERACVEGLINYGGGGVKD